MYHWDVLVKYHWDVVGFFIWDLLETSKRRTDGTSLLRPLETLSRLSNKMSWRRTTETSLRRSTETPLGVSFETYLQHYWNVQRDVVTTSLRHLVAEWVSWVHWIMLYTCINRLDTYISGTFGQTFCGMDKIRYDFNPFSLMDIKLFPIYWGLVVKALDSQSGDLVFKTTRWLYGQLSLSSFEGRSNKYQEILQT